MGVASLYAGVRFHVVEPGTVIQSDDREMAVTEEQAVRRGLEWFLTQAWFDRITAAISA